MSSCGRSIVNDSLVHHHAGRVATSFDAARGRRRSTGFAKCDLVSKPRARGFDLRLPAGLFNSVLDRVEANKMTAMLAAFLLLVSLAQGPAPDGRPSPNHCTAGSETFPGRVI